MQTAQKRFEGDLREMGRVLAAAAARGGTIPSAGFEAVGLGRFRLPRHPTQFIPSFLYVKWHPMTRRAISAGSYPERVTDEPPPVIVGVLDVYWRPPQHVCWVNGML